MVPEGMGPSKKMDDGDRNTEQAVDGRIEDVWVAVGLGDFGEELDVVLQRVPLLTDSLVDHR